MSKLTDCSSLRIRVQIFCKMGSFRPRSPHTLSLTWTTAKATDVERQVATLGPISAVYTTIIEEIGSEDREQRLITLVRTKSMMEQEWAWEAAGECCNILLTPNIQKWQKENVQIDSTNKLSWLEQIKHFRKSLNIYSWLALWSEFLS